MVSQFADEAYASVKGYVRTYVMLQQLLALLDPSSAMLDKARQRLQILPDEAQRRITFVQADGENADEAVDGEAGWTAIAVPAEATTGSFSVSTRTSTLWSSSASGIALISTGRAEQAQRESASTTQRGSYTRDLWIRHID